MSFFLRRRAEAFEATTIVDGLLLGPMPSSLEFVTALSGEKGVEALVSLQTNVDLLTLGFSWEQMETLLRRGGIEQRTRVPIPDFDVPSMVLAIPSALQAIAGTHQRGTTTYVHCTAGINRSPTVVIAYLIQHQGLTLDSACELVNRRRLVLPLQEALERWLEMKDPLREQATRNAIVREETSR